MALFGKKKPNWVDTQIDTLETQLVSEEDRDRRLLIEEELDKLYELKAKNEGSKFKVSPDALFKGALVVGLAYVGYRADKYGSIIPKWSTDSTKALKL